MAVILNLDTFDSATRRSYERQSKAFNKSVRISPIHQVF